MVNMGRWLRNVFTRSVRNFPNSGFKVISDIEKLEEENWDWYKPDLFYPFRIGEVFQSRYQVLGNLDMVHVRRHGFVAISGGCDNAIRLAHH